VSVFTIGLLAGSAALMARRARRAAARPPAAAPGVLRSAALVHANVRPRRCFGGYAAFQFG